MDIDDVVGNKNQIISSSNKPNDDSDGFDLDNMSDDDNAFAQPAKNEEEKKTSDDQNIVKKYRKYDLSITYDFYT